MLASLGSRENEGGNHVLSIRQALDIAECFGSWPDPAAYVEGYGCLAWLDIWSYNGMHGVLSF
jgi:hypothetical protein